MPLPRSCMSMIHHSETAKLGTQVAACSSLILRASSTGRPLPATRRGPMGGGSTSPAPSLSTSTTARSPGTTPTWALACTTIPMTTSLCTGVCMTTTLSTSRAQACMSLRWIMSPLLTRSLSATGWSMTVTNPATAAEPCTSITLMIPVIQPTMTSTFASMTSRTTEGRTRTAAPSGSGTPTPTSRATASPGTPPTTGPACTWGRSPSRAPPTPPSRWRGGRGRRPAAGTRPAARATPRTAACAGSCAPTTGGWPRPRCPPPSRSPGRPSPAAPPRRAAGPSTTRRTSPRGPPTPPTATTAPPLARTWSQCRRTLMLPRLATWRCRARSSPPPTSTCATCTARCTAWRATAPSLLPRPRTGLRWAAPPRPRSTRAWPPSTSSRPRSTRTR
mmetsp:Transcript_30023/g.49063  ORF Transcript_30023/g.49063 Transcript_30023/m.49063 type:complete len:390 (-) Transcript_30023:1934-3103(-)